MPAGFHKDSTVFCHLHLKEGLGLLGSCITILKSLCLNNKFMQHVFLQVVSLSVILHTHLGCCPHPLLLKALLFCLPSVLLLLIRTHTNKNQLRVLNKAGLRVEEHQCAVRKLFYLLLLFLLSQSNLFSWVSWFCQIICCWLVGRWTH